MAQEHDLAAHLAEISADLHAAATEDLTFDAIVARAGDTVPGCDAASVTLRRNHAVATVASTDAQVERLDALQYEFGDGPCLDAAFERGSVIALDLAADGRWARWSAHAQEAGVTGVIAVRLATATETLGALNLYTRRIGGFEDEAADIALIFAAHATDTMGKARLIEGLQAALESRHAIGIAQGVLALRYGITYEQAFDVLRRYSNQSNTKLRAVAAQVLEARDLPRRMPDVLPVENDPA